MPTRVLVIDEEDGWRGALGEGLAQLGCEVDGAAHEGPALERIATLHPHLALISLRAPRLEGLSTLDRALAIAPDLVVVMMSADASVALAVESMRRGAADFVTKPFSLAPPHRALARALATARSRQEILRFAVGEALGVLGDTEPMVQLRDWVARLAHADATTVLVEGESGVGKEVVAQSLHAGGARAGRPFVKLNCAALPERLLELELFGCEQGAFTDASAHKRGAIELAEGGSVLLDEIGELATGSQAKLLRLLEEHSYRRVGGLPELKADVRLIAATNADLARKVSEGAFRTDLFYRLNVVRIRVPPLRERTGDLHTLAAFFVARYNQQLGRRVHGVSGAALERMAGYPWPGNVRELRNAIERAFVLHPSMEELRPEHLPPELSEASRAGPPPEPTRTLEQTERQLLLEAMDRSRGNQSRAARLLAVSRETLRYRLKKHHML